MEGGVEREGRDVGGWVDRKYLKSVNVSIPSCCLFFDLFLPPPPLLFVASSQFLLVASFVVCLELSEEVTEASRVVAGVQVEIRKLPDSIPESGWGVVGRNQREEKKGKREMGVPGVVTGQISPWHNTTTSKHPTPRVFELDDVLFQISQHVLFLLLLFLKLLQKVLQGSHDDKRRQGERSSCARLTDG